MTIMRDTEYMPAFEIKHFYIPGLEDWANEAFTQLINRELHRSELEGVHSIEIYSSGNEWVTIYFKSRFNEWDEEYFVSLLKDEPTFCEFHYLGE